MLARRSRPSLRRRSLHAAITLALGVLMTLLGVRGVAAPALASNLDPGESEISRSRDGDSVAMLGARGDDIRALERSSRSGHHHRGGSAPAHFALGSTPSSLLPSEGTATVQPPDRLAWEAPSRARARLMVFLN